jgi:hypothetical protein
MSSPIADAWNDFLRSIRKLFGRERTLDDFSYDQLRAERAKLEAGEQRILRDLQRLEQEKSALFTAAAREPSQAVQQVQARKIRDINHRAAAMQDNLTRIGKLVRVVDTVMAGRETGRMQEGSGAIADAIRATGALELQDWVEETVAGQSLAEQKVDQLLEAFQDAEASQAGVVQEDAELSAILAQIEEARSADAIAEEAALLRQTEAPRREAPEREG